MTAESGREPGGGEGSGSEPEDETVAVRAGEGADETVVVRSADGAGEADATVAVRAAVRPRSATGNPAPPVPEPERGGLPPGIAERMFKSPLDARHRVPAAPTEAPEHALPRRGVSPGLPVVSATRTSLGATAADAPLGECLGPVPESVPPPPAAPRDGLRSVARADRRFGTAALVGFAAALVCSVLGLWGVALLVWN